ncbi:MAG TPA: thiamine-phosphate kinase [Vicinamibacterales bacterium]|nr:thiamine-phosphate kinase [Vicinamibacterales bacterium]
MTVGDVSERDLVARIQQQAGAAPPWVLVGIGDDAAVVEPERNRVEVLTVDALVEGVHFDRAFVPPAAIGRRALAVNLSDLASMGAAPRLALLSMALPAALPLPDFDAIISGFAALAAGHRVQLVGGNLTRTPGPLMLDVTLVGTVKRRQALTRSGARAGDELYVSGTIGAAAAGLLSLRTSVCPSFSAVNMSTAERYLSPEPRVRLGTLLSRNRAATACVDLSDGLADGAHQIARASGVGVAIDADALPIWDAVKSEFDARGRDPITAAITGGDDYELLFTVRPRTRYRLRAAMRHGGVPLTRIGVCTECPDVVLLRGGTSEAVPPGYSHFG